MIASLHRGDMKQHGNPQELIADPFVLSRPEKGFYRRTTLFEAECQQPAEWTHNLPWPLGDDVAPVLVERCPRIVG